MIDAAFCERIVAGSNRPESPDHGELHWRTVAENGLTLIALGADADPELVLLFALFHDSRRWSEYEDPYHGYRAAHYARAVLVDADEIAADRLDVLVDACERHDQGFTSDDPTTGVCWDADRLDIYRVGIVPDPAFLSTEQAKRSIAFRASQMPWAKLTRIADDLARIR